MEDTQNDKIGQQGGLVEMRWKGDGDGTEMTRLWWLCDYDSKP